jgi:hypothetical protein
MDDHLKKLTTDGEYGSKADDALDLNDLLHPAQAFSHPSDVVNDPDLTLNEKRAILASWACDACAVDSEPALRYAPNGGIRSDSTRSWTPFAPSKGRRPGPRAIAIVASSAGAGSSGAIAHVARAVTGKPCSERTGARQCGSPSS